MTSVRAVVRRIAAAVVVLWAAATAAYLTLLLAPGDTVDSLIGDGPNTQEIRAQVIAEWGLDRSATVQYLDYLRRLAQGDLGRSYLLHRPVVELLGEQLPATAALAAAAGSAGVLLAVSAALLTAGRRGPVRRGAATTELVLASTPTFLIGIVLLHVFSFQLGWFPVSGGQDLAGLVLPALTLALPVAGVLTQVLRDGIERALDEPFVVTARARGLRERAVLARHALRHALLPAVAMVGWISGALLGGAVITEQVFGRPGLGRLTLQAVTSADMPVVLAVVLLSAVVYVAVSTLADLAALLVDPRLRRS